MISSALPAGASAQRRLGQRESVMLLAGLMSLNAIGIDAMLPALPQIARGLVVPNANDQQLVIITYMLGFGVGQLIWGPLADRFGRRPLLIAGLVLYGLFALACAAASSFPLLLAARVACGAAAASSRVLVTAIVRDLFEGEQMAKVMSLIFMVFMVVPVLAPSLGQAILLVAQWRVIFLMLTGHAVLLLVWSVSRLPETLRPDDQRPLDPRAILATAQIVVRDRLAVGYTLASAALFGALAAYVASVQQIISDVFHATHLLPLVFAACAAPMSAAAFANSRIVGRFGLRRVSHAGLIGFLVVSTAHWMLAHAGFESLGLFMLLQGAALASFAFCSSNFGTLAMTNMGELAGTASSMQGVTMTIGGAMIGGAIGRAFDGSLAPFLAGSALAALTALLITLATERMRLFQSIDASKAVPNV